MALTRPPLCVGLELAISPESTVSEEAIRVMRKARVFDAQKHRDNPKMIAKYLNVAMATDDAGVIVKAMGDVLRAHGMARVAMKTGLRREGLYRSFKGNMSPAFDTVLRVLLVLDIHLVSKPQAVVRGKRARGRSVRI
jgi:probable addiction module antidote protein